MPRGRLALRPPAGLLGPRLRARARQRRTTAPWPRRRRRCRRRSRAVSASRRRRPRARPARGRASHGRELRIASRESRARGCGRAPPARVAATVEALAPRLRVCARLGSVARVALGEKVTRVTHRGAHISAVGVGEVTHPHLHVDDVLGDEPRHCGRADVRHLGRHPAPRECCADLGDHALAAQSPVGPRIHDRTQPGTTGECAVTEVGCIRLDALTPQGVDASLELFRGAAVVEEHVGDGAALVVGGLRGDARTGIGLADAGARRDAAPWCRRRGRRRG